MHTADAETSKGSLTEWTYPFMFFVCAGWAVWHTPNYILDFLPPESQSLVDQMSQLAIRKDVTPGLSGLFGGFTDVIDWLALVMLPVFGALGIRTVKCAPMEFQDWRAIDRLAIFVGRVAMIMIISMTGVMLYEVFLRYVVEALTLWANELTLWIAGFVFLTSGFYAMQQRCHIRIFILYEIVPRWLQKVFDVISVALLVLFACGLVFGSYKQVFVVKFYKWEMFGTAFDPPIPATIQPMILIIIPLVALQAILNLISDWNKEPVSHSADAIDETELEAIKRSVEKN